MNKEEYEAEKRRLKSLRTKAGEALRGAQGLAYAQAVQHYDKIKGQLEQLYRTNCGPQPSRAERRCAKLRSKGITPVWER